MQNLGDQVGCVGQTVQYDRSLKSKYTFDLDQLRKNQLNSQTYIKGQGLSVPCHFSVFGSL